MNTLEIAEKTVSGKPFYRRMLHRFVPANFSNVFSLARRLFLEGKPAGRMAMFYAAAGLLLTPLDMFLSLWERGLLARAGQPKLPQLFVGGAPRSGTTLVGQVLIKNLPVHYFNNLTSLFPRAPITASRLFGGLVPDRREELAFDSFYGRTSKLSSPNDALYLWDRWMGADRKKIPTALSDEARSDMARFFGAVENSSGKPLVNKNNSLNTTAHLVAGAMDKACFILLDRDPLYLAQSHYVARRFIHGDESVAYGIRGEIGHAEDPLEDICRQVLFHRSCLREQLGKISPERIIVLPYEDFCARPAYWVGLISEKMLGKKIDPDKLGSALPPFGTANKMKIDKEIFDRLKSTLRRLQAGETENPQL